MKISVKSLLISAMTVSVLVCGCSQNVTSIPESSLPAEEVKISPQNITFEWQDAYLNKLNEYKKSSDFAGSTKTGSRFDIFDITGDNTPELIISPNTNPQTTCKIFTFANGEITELGEAGNRGTFAYLPDIKLIKDEYQGTGFVLGKYISYKDGIFTTVLSYTDNSMSTSLLSGTAIKYEIDGEEVLLPEYEQKLAPYKSETCISAGRKYTFGENTLNYAIKYSESWGAVMPSRQKELYREKLSELLLSSDEQAYAFELCDLNDDENPELIISNGTDDESTCEIYYFEDDELKHIDGTIGANGVFTFDTKQFILSSGVTRWGINDSNFKADDYKHSDSLAEIGRKYRLNESNITVALN
ncbi:MAG: hypothetical protein K2N27_05695 [Ruminococcus sp.]|nr:hypothetical protein [Ruminococcus sp.]